MINNKNVKFVGVSKYLKLFTEGVVSGKININC